MKRKVRNDIGVDARYQTVTFTYRDYRHGSQRKELTLSALEFIRRFRLHILPPGLVHIRHYGILGNNRRKRDIEAARAIFKCSGCDVELEPQIGDHPTLPGQRTGYSSIKETIELFRGRGIQIHGTV